MNRPHPVLLYTTAFVFLIVLFFGLNPKGYDFSNHVTRTADGPGIRFEKYGTAYAQLSAGMPDRVGNSEGFSILLVFQSGRLDNNGSGHILTIHAGEDRNQLVVWQWFSHIIAMNDTDYSHRRKIGRVSAKIPSSPPDQIFLALTTGEKGTCLYFDGKIVTSNHSLRLDVPTGIQSTLVLGNSVYGDSPWLGSISGLALFDRDLPPAVIASLYNSWAKKRSLIDVGNENPLLHYLFDEKEGTEIIDRAGGSTPLIIPARATPLRKEFLAATSIDSGSMVRLTRDAIINLMGFIPLGFLLTALLIRLVGTSEKRAMIHTVLLCFTVSLAIEVFQAWIPSRSSQSLDLILNTAGAWMGAILAARGIPNRYFSRSDR
jgi:VanZ family protein